MRTFQKTVIDPVRNWAATPAQPAVSAASTASTSTKTHRQGDGYIPVNERLLAWWEGRAPIVRDGKGGNAVDVSGGGDTVKWPKRRLEALQPLWGEGFLEPGGASFAKNLLGLAKITSAHTVLDLSTRLGGTAAVAARDFKLWMDAIEPDEELAGHAVRLMALWGYTSQVNVICEPYGTVEIDKRRYDAIYIRERLFQVQARDRLLDQIVRGMKDTGSFLIIDFIASTDPAKAGDRKAWLAAEAKGTAPMNDGNYQEILEGHGLTLAIDQDITSSYMQMIHQSWLKALKSLNSGDIDRRFVNYLVQEGELWLARKTAMANGAMTVRKMQLTFGQ